MLSSLNTKTSKCFQITTRLHPDLESISSGRPLAWKHNGKYIPIKQLFMSGEGKREFTLFLYDLEQIEQRILSLLMRLP